MPSRNDAQLQADARALHEAINALVRVYQVRDRERICCHDISVTQCAALEILIERGALRSQALAEALMLDKSTVTRVVDALVRKGYVARGADPDDGRALSLRATASGRALHARIERELLDEQARLVADLDPEVRAGAAELIRRLARAAETRLHGGAAQGNAACAPGCG